MKTMFRPVAFITLHNSLGGRVLSGNFLEAW